jgi:hypothetical protein
MPDGYLEGGKPDVGWWLAQLEAARRFRDKYAHETLWDRWRAYYRGNWRSGVIPANKFFSFLRATVPRVYFRNPAVSVTPGMPGYLELAFAHVTNQLDNKVIREIDLKREAKMIVQDTFFFGTGIGKLGYGARFDVGINSGAEPGGIDRRGMRVEYDSRAMSDMFWFSRVPTGSFLVPAGVRDFRSARWVAEEVKRPKNDVAEDERFDPKARKDLPATKTEAFEAPTEYVDLVEIRDKKTGQVIVLAPYGSSEQDGGKVLLVAEDEFQTLTNGDVPYFPVQFNADDEVFWGVPDAKILEPLQLEANEIRTQTMKHRRLSIVKLLVKQGIINDEERQKMLSEDVAAFVEVGEMNGPIEHAVSKLTVADIPQSLILASGLTEQDIRETLGFSRNQTGEYQSRRGDTSATEAAIVNQASEIRLDERRDAMADMLEDTVRMINPVMFENWTGEQVQELVGPGGAKIWVRFNPSNLKMGHYVVHVDADTAQPRTRQQRETKAVAVYQLLKTNPLIDPQALTRYLLTEMGGVELDDLMRALPPVPNQGSAPMGLGQYADVLQQSVRGAGARGSVPPALLGAGEE